MKVYNDVFDSKKCDYIKNAMLRQFEANELTLEANEYSGGSYGSYNLKETMFFVPYLDKIIKNDYGHNITFENTYTRIYKKNNELKIHTDRQGLDITLSICIYSDVNFNWPIFISNEIVNGLWSTSLPIESYKESFQSFDTPPGTGIACHGTRSPHWRNPLMCEDDQMVIQCFYHWKLI